MGNLLACPYDASLVAECVEVSVYTGPFADVFTPQDLYPVLAGAAALMALGFVVQRIRRTIGG